MKKYFVLTGALLLLLAMAGPAAAADPNDPREKAYAEAVGTFTVPQLVGSYTGYTFMVHEETDIKNMDQFLGQKPQVFNITEQNLMMVRGNKTYFNKDDQKQYTEHFSGVITVDGKHLLIAEKEDGFMEVDILDDGRLVAYYTEDGSDFKSLAMILDKAE